MITIRDRVMLLESRLPDRYAPWRPLHPKINETIRRIRNTMNSISAIVAATPESTPKPRTAATIAMIKNTTAQYNNAITHYLYDA